MTELPVDPNLLAHIFKKLILTSPIPCSQCYLTVEISSACGSVLLNIKYIF